MNPDTSKVQIELEHLESIAPFIMVADEDTNVTWASNAILTRFKPAVGMKASELIEFAEPSKECSHTAISAKLGQCCKLSLLISDSKIPLAGQWDWTGNEFVLLATPDPNTSQDLEQFTFDDFPVNDHLIDLLVTRDENTKSLSEALSAARELKEKNKVLENSDQSIQRIDGQRKAILNMAQDIETTNKELAAEITERKRIEERISHLNCMKEQLLVPAALDKKLKLITDAIVKIFDADFARVWIIKLGDLCDSGCVHAKVKDGPHVCRYRDRCLHLLASSGRYTHVDGEMHRRVPFACYKIGHVAAGTDAKFVTNDVTHDQRVHNHDWARKLGLVSFAGYRLVSAGEKPVGVLALFSKQPISDKEDSLLENVANTTTQVIQIATAEAELKETHQRLIDASHRAGMAEVATGVLHNVGNVLNSINISVSSIQNKILNSKATNLKKVTGLIAEHSDELGTFFTEDERGKHIPLYLTEAARLITDEQADITEKLRSLTKNVEHIKEIVKTQQAYAGVGGVEVLTGIGDVIDDAIQINSAGLQRHGAKFKLEIADLPEVYIDKQRVLQILVNLMSNAKYALSQSQNQEKVMTVRCYRHDEDRLRIEVADNGVGIPQENLSKIFRHGFTTKKDGHGFGLHSSALAAKEIGGSLTCQSDGIGHGATFILELPFKPEEVRECTR